MNVNKVLRQIAYNIYQKRPVIRSEMRTNYRIERANGGLLCDLWFLTTGCIHDAQGGCVMCNYGKGSKGFDCQSILGELQHITKSLPWEFEDFLLTSSGSILDKREVSEELRIGLRNLLKDIKTRRFIIESRSDTISDSGIDFLKSILPSSEKYIEIGMESSNDWILKHCVNKNSTFAEFKKATNKIHGRGVKVVANIGIGFPFMSERANVEETIKSVKDAIGIGVDSIVLFPYHIKTGTVLEDLYQKKLYQSISMWAMIEVLGSLTKEELTKVQISWYKDYFGKEKSYIQHSPSTCPSCWESVMELLDQYRYTQDYDCMKRLYEFPCQCHEQWRKRIAGQKAKIDIDEVVKLYQKMGRIYGIENALMENELQIMQKEFRRIGYANELE